MTSNYYQKHKENLQKKACERYLNLSDEEKIKKEERGLRQISKYFVEKERKRQYHRERNKNLSERQKQVDYMRNYYLAHKKTKKLKNNTLNFLIRYFGNYLFFLAMLCKNFFFVLNFLF